MSDNEDFIEEEHSDADDYNDGEYANDSGHTVSSALRVITQLRTNDRSIFSGASSTHRFVISPSTPDLIRLEIAKALTQSTIVRHIKLQPHDYSKLSADAMAKYLMCNKRLLHVDLIGESLTLFDFFTFGMAFASRGEKRRNRALCKFIEAVGQSTSVTNLSLTNLGLRPASVSFEYLLTRTKTLQFLTVDLERQGHLGEAATAAIASGFSKNTTLREIKLVDWHETSLIPVLTALQKHPVLEGLEFEGISSFTGIDAFLGSKHSQLKQLVIARFNGSTTEQVVGFESFMLKMGRNTTILKMVIACVPLSGENIQQLKAMLRRNTVLQDLNLSGDALGSTGLVEIASALYRNTSIQTLDVSANGLDDLASANALRELLRRNKTITRIILDRNKFGNNVAAVRSIADGFRTSTTLQVLDLASCALGDQGLSILAECLGRQKRGLVNLDLSANHITCSGLRALLNNATATLSTLAHLNLNCNPILDEGATFLAETLKLQTLPSLKNLRLVNCDISDDGFVALVSALEENETLETVDLEMNNYTDEGFLALASGLPNIKGLRQIDFSWKTSDPSVTQALLEGFRKNTSLHDVNILDCGHGKLSQELSFLMYRNKFSRLLQDSDTDDRESLGLWSRALNSVATRPDVLFHVLTSKAGLIRATPVEDSKKRKRDGSE
jgi:Ran GTPase-activating protein (RanGAP) involved in mRNA processing and transport